MDENVPINFISRSILHIHEFSWVFLVDWLMVLALSVFALFYFNQLLGFVFTNTVGWYVWHRYGVYLKIQSIQISLLGGRIIFKNIVYVGTSQAVRVVHGALSWRYWLHYRRKAAFFASLHQDRDDSSQSDYSTQDSRNTGSTFASDEQPRREPTTDTTESTFIPNGTTDLALNLKVYGVEWFVYNREYAYDSLAKQESPTAELAEEFERWQRGLSFVERKVMELLPLHLDVKNLGSIIGNDDTESLVVVSSHRVNCVVDMAAASTSADRYMSTIDARFNNLKIELKDNLDYQVTSITPEKQQRNFSRKKRRHLWMRKLIQKTNNEPYKPWFGLKRYLEPDEDENISGSDPASRQKGHSQNGQDPPSSEQGDNEKGDTEKDEKGYNESEESDSPPNSAEILSQLAALPSEYGKVSQIVACDSLDFQFRVDVVGPAKPQSNDDESDPTLSEEDKAGMPAPLFDIKMVFQGAKINYGPYAERQRQSFFNIFFPQNWTLNANQDPVDSPCGLRLHPHASVSISFQEETTLLVPVREKSKDESFAATFIKSLQSFGGEIQRSYGWLEVGSAEGSKIDILIPFIPQPSSRSGRENMLEYATHCDITLIKPVVRSSVNHDTFFRADVHEFKSVQYQTNTLNTETTYSIEQKSTNLDCFLLREHVTLVSDTILDFATGPPVPYYLFTPSVYLMSWEFSQLSLYMNVNKGNIINKPCSLTENTFLILRAPICNAQWTIPRTEIAAPVTLMQVDIHAPKIDLDLSAPSWHTLQGFLDSQRMASVDDFNVHLQNYVTTLAVSEQDTDSQFETNISRFVDTQVVDINGHNFAMTAHGFLIEYIMRIRENYFGHAYHFQTKEEFLDKMSQEHQHTAKYEFKRSDVDTVTDMRIRVSRGCFLLPKRLFSSKDCIAFHFVEMNVDMRFTNYYMDLQVEIAPIMGRFLTGINAGTAFEEALSASWSKADLSICNLEVHAHRMFGLPPVEPTYVVRWDFAVGDITGDLHPSFLNALFEAKLVFKHSLADDENKPIITPEELNDVTFLSLDVNSIDVIVRPTLASAEACETYVQFSTSTIKLRSNDLANDRYSGWASCEVPYVRIRAFSKHPFTREDVMVMEADTAVMVTNYIQKPFRKEQHRKQQDHIALHDLLFKRADFLINDDTKKRYPYTRKRQHDDLRPCIPLTPLAMPMTRENVELLNSKIFFSADVSHRHSWDRTSSRHTSLESLVDVGDDAHDSFISSLDDNESNDDTNVHGEGDDDADIPSMAKQARAQYSGPTPDVYPFSSQTVSEDRERIRNMKADFQFQQGPWHLRAPEMEDIDDDMQHCNLLIQIMPVTAHITPNLMVVLKSFQSENEVVDFESQLDVLQIMIVKGLVKENTPMNSLRLFLTVPAVDLNFSEEIRSKYGGVRFTVESMDVKAQVLDTDLKGMEIAFENLALSLRQDVSFTSVSRMHAAAVILSKFEFWWQETSDQDNVGSLNLNGVDASLASDQIEWTVNYISKLVDAFPTQIPGDKGGDKQGGNLISKNDELKATFYALTIAGENMGVEQDSYVLSKPSGTIQTQDHVRTMMSWRIVMRLRYLLQRIPPTQRKEMESAIAHGTYTLPPDAKEQMLDVYRNWRSWEQSKDLEDTEIFKQVFRDRSFQEYVLSLSIKLSLNIESMVARVIYPDMHDHFVGLDSLCIILASTQKNKVQNLGLTVRCSKARARGSMELVTVSATIIESLAKVDAERQRKQESAESVHSQFSKGLLTRPVRQTLHTVKTKDSDAINLNQTGSRALQANISVFLLDLILEFDLERIHIETQNHQIQFAAAVELMETKDLASLFHIGTLVSTDGAFRIYRTSVDWPMHARRHSRVIPQDRDHDDIFDSLVKGVQLGYASRGLGPQSNTWATLNIDSVSFMSHLTANELAHLMVDFLQIELPAIRQTAAKLESTLLGRKETSDNDESCDIEPHVLAKSLHRVKTDSTYNTKNTTKSSASSIDEEDQGESTAGQFMNVSIGSLKIKTRLVDELRFVWLARELDFKIRNIGDIVSSFSVERSTVGIHFSETYEAVANIQFELVRSIIKYDPNAVELMVFTNADAIRLGTMSLVWILEYSKHRSIDVQISEVMETLSRAIELMHPSPESEAASPPVPQASSPSEVEDMKKSRSLKRGFTLRVASQIGEISIRLPLDSSSFQLTIEGAYYHCENMRNADAGPRSFSGGIKDMKLELVSTEQKSREMVKLQFDMSVHKSKEKIVLNLASDYLRFGLDPESVGALFIAAEKLNSYSRDFFNAKSTKSIVQNSQKSSDSSKGFSYHISDLENVRAKLLSKNTNITWFTSLESNDGVVIGYERLQLKFAKLISSLELAAAYITPLNGLQVPMNERFNTIYVPLVSASAVVNKPVANEKPWVRVAVTGESVAMTIIPSVATWILNLRDSIDKTTQTLRKITENMMIPLSSSSSASSSSVSILIHDTRAHNDHDFVPASESSPTAEPFQFPVNISVNTDFERSVLRLFDEGGRQKEPVLELFSPSLQVTFGFADQKLMLRVDASKTSNKIYPKAISELKATTTLLNKGLKERARRRRSHNFSSVPKENIPSRSGSPSKHFNHSEQGKPSAKKFPFEDIEIDFRLHFESQEVYLSCLPYGKVGASLSTEGVDIVIMTQTAHTYASSLPPHRSMESLSSKDLERSLLTIFCAVKHTQISLQHIYSSEISAKAELHHFSALAMSYKDEPMKIVSNIHDPRLDIKLTKLLDMRIFFDIWALYENPAKVSDASPEPIPQSTQLRRKYSTSSAISRPTVDFPLSPAFAQQNTFNDDNEDPAYNDDDSPDADDNTKLLDKYKSAIAAVGTALIVNLNVTGLSGVIGMGPAIGDLHIDIDRIWLALLQTPSMEQMANLGISKMVARFEGRLGGALQIDGLMAKTAFKWKHHQARPLVHAKLKFSKIGFYFSLDFHPFIAGNVIDFSTVLTTQDRADVQDDRVHVAVTCTSVSIITTALVIVHTFDVLALFKRLQSQISSAPIFMMPEVSEENAHRSAHRQAERDKRIQEHQRQFNGIRVLMDVQLGRLLIHAFPTEFADNVGLRVFAQRVDIHYDRSHFPDRHEASMDLAVDESIVGLANIRGGGYKETLTDLDFEHLIEFVSQSTPAGTIFNTPEVTLVMDTWDYVNVPNVIYYKFSNQVHGSVDVGWNFGSVSFIKEMMHAHRDAWATRQDLYEASLQHLEEEHRNVRAYREAAANLERKASMRKKADAEATIEETSSISSNLRIPGSLSPTKILQQKQEAQTPNMELLGVKYIARESPIVQIPQLHDLGDATPPIEWLGVNRERIPLFIHAFLMKKLGLAAEEIEKLYLEAVGRME